MPCMLMSEADPENQEVISEAEVPALLVRFTDGNLALPMFPRLVILFLKWCAESCPEEEQPELHKNFAQLYLDDGYSVILACKLNVISLSVFRERDPKR